MEKFVRLLLLLSGYLALTMITLGYRIGTAEEIETEPGGLAGKAGKHVLVLLKLLLFPR